VPDEPVFAQHWRFDRRADGGDRADALIADAGQRFDYVLANPPFGKKSSMTITNAEGDEDRDALTIPFLNHPCTLSASLAVRLYCRRFAFAFTNDLKMELSAAGLL
jgi:hypothetical protein